MILKQFLIPIICLVISLPMTAQSTQVDSCQRQLKIDKPPQRAVSHDVNLTEMMFALELQSHMVGYTGISGWHHISSEFQAAAKKLPQLASKAPTLEQLLQVKADFLFAGWNYGLKLGGSLTPAALKPFGITVYELTESCIHVMKKKVAHFDDIYNDLLNLGKIFNVEKKAQQLVQQYQEQILRLRKTTDKAKETVRVFIYDSGQHAPFTAGNYAIPTAMIEAAGGQNIMQDLNSSWIRANWEDVVARNPEFIVIVNYGEVSAKAKIEFLKQDPAMQQVAAVKNENFIVLNYNEVTPGVMSFSATERLAQAFHPELFTAK